MKKLAKVAWTAKDIKDLKPEWSLARCEEFLEEIETNLQDMMISRGWEHIEHELNQGD